MRVDQNRKPLTTDALGRAVAEELGVSRDKGARAVRAVFDAIVRSVAEGGSVKVANFGTFGRSERAGCVRRNPATGGAMEVSHRFDIRFRISPEFRKMVRGERPVGIGKKPREGLGHSRG